MKLIIIIIIVAIVNFLQSSLNRPKRNRVNRRDLNKKPHKEVKNTKGLGKYIKIDEMIKPYLDPDEEDNLVEEVSEIVEDKIDTVKVEKPRDVEVKPYNIKKKKHKSKLSMEKKNIAQGIIWNEILNKPKSLRK
ncbi:hypothetical protein [Anaeromicrobium sediminis]|uniref:Uncharacterized protein n=1 Tax=Anaeromicrobium sediminis TaxID=1478221 RepID=A0A267MJH2_9FIRM|nr:hypothetical protein [Anaeromicrobium sediminis]PAB58930.1 hypothetical protein CCE28_12155 [Anaeromicrobium sediminis]